MPDVPYAVTIRRPCLLLSGGAQPTVGGWPTLIGVAPTIHVACDMSMGGPDWRGGPIESRGPFTTTERAQAEADKWVAEMYAAAPRA
jgi:hypothetical protein